MLDRPNIYLLGIGGIGMSALARYFQQSGRKVAGYDRFRSPLCEELEAEGMKIHYEESLKSISPNLDPENTLVIYTPAIPEEHAELRHFLEKKFTVLKRAKVLGLIAQKHRCLAIAGTHGKTTTSSILAHLFRHSSVEISAFLGGITTNYQSNFWGNDDTDLLVAEADEYDRSFLNLKPSAAVITSTDADHLDIYGEAEQLKQTFLEFGESVSDFLLVHEDSDLEIGLKYGFSNKNSYYAEQVRVEDHQFHFDMVYPQGRINNIAMLLPGRHNIENALAAGALALKYGLSADEVKAGLESFKGVKRRFEYHIKQNHLVYIDDYAHHPKEISALAKSVRELYPDRKITAIFQPHLYSRTRDFMEDFAESLSAFDELILLELYPARERPIAGITSHSLLEKVSLENKSLLARQEILTRYTEEKPEVILTLGAGDIDQLIRPLKVALLK
jgi:UDP-N-acetylmuramate--alanine ligase